MAIRECSEAGKWPGIHRICKALSVAPSTFYEHLDIDAEFKAAYDDALLALEDSLVDNLVRQGQSANGVTANIFLLKNRWPKRWNEDYTLNFRGDSAQLKGLVGNNNAFIDAEIVPPPPITSTPLQIDANRASEDGKPGSQTEKR